jgi:hypothetical protein
MFALLTLSSSQLADAANIAKPQEKILRNKILNGICCVPNLSSGSAPRKMKNGAFKATEDNCSIEITLNDVTFGEIDKKPVAVAVLSACGGGSGIFVSLLLYDLENGSPLEVASYAVGDRADVKSVNIRSDGVRLIFAPFNPGQNDQNPYGFKQPTTAVLIKRAKFEKVECIQYELSNDTKNDIAKLVTTYIAAWSNKPLTAEQKQQALEICSHQKDKAKFAKEFRLTLDAEGYDSGPHPLTFDQAGKPILHIDDQRKSEHHVSIELAK